MKDWIGAGLSAGTVVQADGSVTGTQGNRNSFRNEQSVT